MYVLGLCSGQILCYIHINYIDMRKILNFFMMMALGVILTGCYDDTLLWDEMKDVKNRLTILENAAKQTSSDITCLQTLVEAMQRNVYVTSVNTTTDGYVINFSDGSTATVSNGKDRVNGTNAPIISVRLDVDGNYYWTLDYEWLTVDGERVRANGIDGEKGKDAIPLSPQKKALQICSAFFNFRIPKNIPKMVSKSHFHSKEIQVESGEAIYYTHTYAVCSLRMRQRKQRIHTCANKTTGIHHCWLCNILGYRNAGPNSSDAYQLFIRED